MFTIKKTLLLSLLLLFAGNISATHIVGGGMTYECLGNSGNGKLYRFTMKVYVDCFNSNVGFDDPAYIAIYRGTYQSNTLFADFEVSLISVKEITVNQTDCIDDLPFICLEEGTYTFERVLPNSTESYFIEYQRCCRTSAITNIIDPEDTGATYSVEITPLAQQLCNSSPAFNNFPPVVICNNYPLEVDYSATDPDGDMIVYSFCAPFAGGGGAAYAPPFDEVVFISPNYTATEPMSGNPVIQINPQTGVISGTPLLNGQYVVGVCVEEYRNGQLLSVTHRDFHFNVTPCDPQVIALVQYDELAGPKHYVIKKCDGATNVTIINESFSQDNIETFEWNFDLNGTPLINNTDFDMTLDFPGLGIYDGILVLNEGLDCGDTAFIRVELYAPASLDLGPDILVCKDSLIVLDAGPDFSSYLWQDGSTGQTFSANTTGSYLLAARDACGNINNDTVNVTVLPTPMITRVIQFYPNQSVTLGGQTYDQMGTVVLTVPSTTGGCDSLNTYILEVIPTTLDLDCPSNLMVAMPNNAISVPVNYSMPLATTNCPGTPLTIGLVQGLPSGGNFPAGLTTVCYEGSNICGNKDTCCFNVTVLDSEPACDIKVIGCIKYELLDIRLDSINQPRFRIRVTNYCASEIDYAMIELPPGIVGVTPQNNSIYIAPNTGNQYVVRNPNASPFYSTRYRSIWVGINNGQSDILEQCLPQQSFHHNYIHMNAKLKNGQAFAAYLNTFYCPVQLWAGSKFIQGRKRENEAIDHSSLAIWPNPTDGLLYIDLSQWEGHSAQIHVLNAQGQLVMDRRLEAGNEWLDLSLDGALANGLYYLMVKPEGGEKVATKFVLER